MWESPGARQRRSTRSQNIWAAYRAEAGAPAWQRLTEYDHAVDAVRPATPHWYLGVLATRPDRQGEGLATAVMAPVLERADADGIDCFLETSRPGNRAFYERRGFTDVADVPMVSGPPTWWLRRAPATTDTDTAPLVQ